MHKNAVAWFLFGVGVAFLLPLAWFYIGCSATQASQYCDAFMFGGILMTQLPPAAFFFLLAAALGIFGGKIPERGRKLFVKTSFVLGTIGAAVLVWMCIYAAASIRGSRIKAADDARVRAAEQADICANYARQAELFRQGKLTAPPVPPPFCKQ